MNRNAFLERMTGFWQDSGGTPGCHAQAQLERVFPCHGTHPDKHGQTSLSVPPGPGCHAHARVSMFPTRSGALPLKPRHSSLWTNSMGEPGSCGEDHHAAESAGAVFVGRASPLVISASRPATGSESSRVTSGDARPTRRVGFADHVPIVPELPASTTVRPARQSHAAGSKRKMPGVWGRSPRGRWQLAFRVAEACSCPCVAWNRFRVGRLHAGSEICPSGSRSPRNGRAVPRIEMPGSPRMLRKLWTWHGGNSSRTRTWWRSSRQP